MSEPTRGPLPAPKTHPDEFDAGFSEHAGYASALTHLYGRLNTEALDPVNFARVERNLDSFRSFLGMLGDAHLATPTIHITGTRGKGSTLAMLEAILIEAGYRTGATISPHLVEVRERIRIAGKDLSREQFSSFYEQIQPIADQRMNQTNYRTVFEILTALAFFTFKELNVDAALVEVGMGGRLDATNIVSPVLSIVTRVGLDHTQVLGDTVEAIAEDKAQIIKSVAPAILSRQVGNSLSVLRERCKEVGVEGWAVDHEIKLLSTDLKSSGTKFSLWTPHRTHHDLHIPLLGAHQAENAAVAVAAADRLDADGTFSISSEAIIKGLKKTNWAGRGEILSHNPIFMIDGAHTDQGASALSKMLDSLFPDKDRILILGMNRDKDPRAFLDSFKTSPTHILATQADSPRSMTADELATIVEERGIPCTTVALHESIHSAQQIATNDDIIIATGSFYVIGALRRLWLREMNSTSTLQT
jgi:dihydrofolate synthase / folylpolyglutamate synthase